jgi:hypothetical protein
MNQSIKPMVRKRKVILQRIRDSISQKIKRNLKNFLIQRVSKKLFVSLKFFMNTFEKERYHQ